MNWHIYSLGTGLGGDVFSRMERNGVRRVQIWVWMTKSVAMNCRGRAVTLRARFSIAAAIAMGKSGACASSGGLWRA